MNIYTYIIICAAVLAFCVLLARSGQVRKIRSLVLALVCAVEVEWGSKTGEIKKATVMERLYELLPGWAKVFISEKTLSAIIEDGKREMDSLGEEVKSKLAEFKK